MKALLKIISTVLLLHTVSIRAESFVQVKKISVQKPSQTKEEIVDLLESLLTSTSDLIASVAQEQHLIVEKVRDVAQGQGAFSQTSPQALIRYRDSLAKMEQELVQQTQMVQKQFVALKKDFLERS